MTKRTTLLIPVIAGFGVVLLILAAVIASNLGQVSKLGRHVTGIVEEQNRKMDLALRMRNIHRERYFALLRMAYQQDPFDRDQAYMGYCGLAEDFIKSRDAFLDIPQDEEELEIWQRIRGEIRVVGARAEAVLEDIQQPSTEELLTAIRQQIAPAQERMMAGWDELVVLQKRKNEEVMKLALAAEARTLRMSYSLGGLALLISSVVAFFVIRTSLRQERALREQQEKDQIILNAIGDAVIHVDASGWIGYLNPAARLLLGVDSDAPEDGSHHEPLRLIDRQTRQPLIDRLLREVKQGHSVALPPNTRLISVHGIELEIEGTCAPIPGSELETPAAVLVLRDVTEAREWLRAHTDQWDRDVLTSLPGPRFMEKRVAQALTAKRSVDLPMAYLDVRIEGVEDLYERHGAAAGDSLIRHLVILLRTRIRDTDILARMGADSFAVLLSACPVPAAERIEQEIRSSLAGFRFNWNGEFHVMPAQVGAAHIPPFSGAVDELLAAARTAAAAT